MRWIVLSLEDDSRIATDTSQQLLGRLCYYGNMAVTLMGPPARHVQRSKTVEPEPLLSPVFACVLVHPPRSLPDCPAWGRVCWHVPTITGPTLANHNHIPLNPTKLTEGRIASGWFLRIQHPVSWKHRDRVNVGTSAQPPRHGLRIASIHPPIIHLPSGSTSSSSSC